MTRHRASRSSSSARARPASPPRRCWRSTASTAWCWTAGPTSTRSRARCTSTTRSSASSRGSASPTSSPRSPGPRYGLRLLDNDDARAGRVPVATPRAACNGFPQANMFDQPELEALLRTNLKRYPRAELRGNVEVTDVADDERRTDPGHVRRPHRRLRARRRRRLRAGLRRRQQRRARRIGSTHARSEVRAALAGRRRRPPMPISTSGTACTRSAIPSARAPTCASGRPATAGSFGCCPARPPTTSRTLTALQAAHRAVDRARRRRRTRADSRRRSTRSARRSPTGGGAATSSCSATPPTSPRRSSARAWAPDCATR